MSGNASSIKPSVTVYLASFAALCGALTMGLALGYTAPANDDMARDRASNGSTIFDPDDAKFEAQKSMIGSMLALGALVGGLVAEPVNRKLGRRLSLILTGVPFVVGWLLIGLANSLGLIISGRLLTGLCSGLVSGIAPTYVVEIAPPEIRGLLGTCFQVMVVIGMLTAALVGSLVSWSTLASLSLLGALCMSALMLFMPETPQWLLSKGRDQDAELSLTKLRTSAINNELQALTNAAKQAQQTGGEQYSLSMMASREFYKPLALALALMFFQQFSGINAVLFYQSDIFKRASPTSNSAASTIYVCIAQVVATIAGSVLVDRLGRRVLLLLSGLTMGLSLIVFGVYSHYSAADESWQLQYAWIALVSLVVFVSGFSIGYGPITWMMIPEFSSARVRSTIASIATAFNWTCAYVITGFVKSFLLLVGDAWTYWIFAIFCLFSCLFVLVVLPETKGRSSDQIQSELLGIEARNVLYIQEGNLTAIA